MIAVYVLFGSIIAMSAVEISLSNIIMSSFNDYLEIKGTILFKITGEESIVKPLIKAGIVMSSIFIGITVVGLGLYIYQNHFRKYFLPIVTVCSTV